MRAEVLKCCGCVPARWCPPGRIQMRALQQESFLSDSPEKAHPECSHATVTRTRLQYMPSCLLQPEQSAQSQEHLSPQANRPPTLTCPPRKCCTLLSDKLIASVFYIHHLYSFLIILYSQCLSQLHYLLDPLIYIYIYERENLMLHPCFLCIIKETGKACCYQTIRTIVPFYKTYSIFTNI